MVVAVTTFNFVLFNLSSANSKVLLKICPIDQSDSKASILQTSKVRLVNVYTEYTHVNTGLRGNSSTHHTETITLKAEWITEHEDQIEW